MKAGETRAGWSTKKRDPAPRGVFRHSSGVWAVRFTCGAGCIHKERVGTLKGDAVRVYHERRARVLDEPGWCPRAERDREQKRARADRARETARVTFREYATDYLAWSKLHKLSWTSDRAMLTRLLPAFGNRKLDEITTADVERFRESLLEQVARATVNRYTALLSGIFHRALRGGFVAASPVRGLSRFKESGQRLAWLAPEEEVAIHEVLPPALRPLFTVSVHTGLRWSEQTALRWRDVDVLAGTVTVITSKNGHARRVPMNSVVRSVVVDLAAGRERPDDSEVLVFPCRHKQADKFFPRAVERAQEALREAGKDAARLDGYTWHCNRHTFASRLVMAGVDLRTVQELGGWRTLALVERYAHLAPDHLQAAVERLVPAAPAPAVPAAIETAGGTLELTRNYPAAPVSPAGVS